MTKATKTKAAKPYFVLLSRDDTRDPWAIEFGAWDKSDVDSERQDRRDHFIRASNLKIIAVPGGRQKAINEAVAKLNTEQAEANAIMDRHNREGGPAELRKLFRLG